MTPEDYVVAIGQLIGGGGMLLVTPLLLFGACWLAYKLGRESFRRITGR